MVKKDPCLYLFLGEDALSKDTELKKIKDKFIPPDIRDFNLDVLYSKGLTLKKFQETLLCLPVQSRKRIVVIKEAERLREDVQEFILEYARKPLPQIILIFDVTRRDKQDKSGFIDSLCAYSQIHRFKETIRLDTFQLVRQIELKNADYALRILAQLLKEGERPERILGGLRYAWEKSNINHAESRKRIKLLVSCDADIKTGRMKPAFALERLIVSLSYLVRLCPVFVSGVISCGLRYWGG